MNFAQRLTEQGRAMLAKQSPQADVVTFNGRTFAVNIRRNSRGPEMDGQIPVGTLEESVIEFPVGETIPETNDTLVDSKKITHRVKRPALHIGHAIQLTCEVLR